MNAGPTFGHARQVSQPKVFSMRLSPLAIVFSIALPASAFAGSGYHPFAPQRDGVRTVDLSAEARARDGQEGYKNRPYPETIAFGDLDEHAAAVAAEGEPAGPPPGGLHPRGSVVVPAPIAAGELVDPAVMHAVEDIPGYEYPRKHTMYINFVGGMLYNGSDNSAESRSSLARHGEYPAYTGGEAKAIAAAQETANDVSQFGINVVYADRPPQLLPYTMVMVGGNWTDTNLEDSAAGVAPGTDCGALGQRHVVYTFANSGWSATAIANVNGQEAGHSWGLDHSLNCGSVMSYCGSGNGNFSSSCDGLCEAQCQGDAGCRLFHEDFCGVGSDQQNEVDELSFLFGGNEPDLEPPYVEIVSPADDLVVPEGSDVNLRAIVDDNYGGYAWRFIIQQDGEVVYDQIDYDRDVDEEYRAALNLVNMDPGTYVLTIEVLDHFDHLSTDTVNLVVEPVAGGEGGVDESGDAGDEGPGDTSAGSGGGTAGDGPFGTDDGEPTSAGSDAGFARDDQGCACRASGSGGGNRPPWGLLGLCVLGLAVGRARTRGYRRPSR